MQHLCSSLYMAIGMGCPSEMAKHDINSAVKPFLSCFVLYLIGKGCYEAGTWDLQRSAHQNWGFVPAHILMRCLGIQHDERCSVTCSRLHKQQKTINNNNNNSPRIHFLTCRSVPQFTKHFIRNRGT